MDKDVLTKVSELLMRASLVAKEIGIEEEKLSQAVHNERPEEIETIRDRLSFLKRKHSLFLQAAKMKESKG
jgi:protein-arginine kinase activator protein McsA